MRKALLIRTVTDFTDNDARLREEVIASADIDDSAEVIERFMRKANPWVCNIKLNNGIIIDIPIAPTREGFFMMLALGKEKGPGDPYILPSRLEGSWIRFE